MKPVESMIAAIQASPTPRHAVQTAAAKLANAGFENAADNNGAIDYNTIPPHGFLAIEGSLYAWKRSPDRVPTTLRIIGAHTDSPNIRIKSTPDRPVGAVDTLWAQPYGGVLYNSWLDRDLGVAGRVITGTDGQFNETLFHIDRPVARIAQLAIHLDRGVNDRGVQLNAQDHLNPIWAMHSESTESFIETICKECGVDPDMLLSWEAMLCDTQKPATLGKHNEFVVSGRLDNLCSSFGSIDALIEAEIGVTTIALVALLDHEEVGSNSATGAMSSRLSSLISVLFESAGATSQEQRNSLANSQFLSADMAHAVHPNYIDIHDTHSRVELGAGIVVKSNVNQKYATSVRSTARFVDVMNNAGCNVQHFTNRADLACGSTIGPQIAANLGIDVVDAGMPMLSMHSIREQMAANDLNCQHVAFTAWLSS